MNKESEHTIIDQLAFSCFSGLVGAIYGVLIAIVLFFVTNNFHYNIIAFAVATFAVLGFFYGNFTVEAILLMLYFLVGLVHGLGLPPYPLPSSLPEGVTEENYLKSFVVFGFATGIVLTLWWCF